MDNLKGQGGIQLLLAAEQEAQQIVADARQRKMARLKQAKDEAEKEAVSYRAHLEAEYQKKISENTSNSGSNVRALEDETEVKIQKLKEVGAHISPNVVDIIMKYVTAVRT